MIKIRNKLHRRKKRQSNNENIKRLYNLFRNRIIREMKKSKRDHYNKYFEKHRNDVKKTWNGIRSIIKCVLITYVPSRAPCVRRPCFKGLLCAL